MPRFRSLNQPEIIDHAWRLEVPVVIAPGCELLEHAYHPGDWMVILTDRQYQAKFMKDDAFRKFYKPMQPDGQEEMDREVPLVIDESTMVLQVEDLKEPGGKYFIVERAQSLILPPQAHRGWYKYQNKDNIVISLDHQALRHIPIKDIGLIVELEPPHVSK